MQCSGECDYATKFAHEQAEVCLFIIQGYYRIFLLEKFCVFFLPYWASRSYVSHCSIWMRCFRPNIDPIVAMRTKGMLMGSWRGRWAINTRTCSHARASQCTCSSTHYYCLTLWPFLYAHSFLIKVNFLLIWFFLLLEYVRILNYMHVLFLLFSCGNTGDARFCHLLWGMFFCTAT